LRLLFEPTDPVSGLDGTRRAVRQRRRRAVHLNATVWRTRRTGHFAELMIPVALVGCHPARQPVRLVPKPAAAVR
jgi:hypothetical protein